MKRFAGMSPRLTNPHMHYYLARDMILPLVTWERIVLWAKDPSYWLGNESCGMAQHRGLRAYL